MKPERSFGGSERTFRLFFAAHSWGRRGPCPTSGGKDSGQGLPVTDKAWQGFRGCGRCLYGGTSAGAPIACSSGPGRKGARRGTRRCGRRRLPARRGTHPRPRPGEGAGIRQGPDGPVGIHAEGFRNGFHEGEIMRWTSAGIGGMTILPFAGSMPEGRPTDYQRLPSTCVATALRAASEAGETHGEEMRLARRHPLPHRPPSDPIRPRSHEKAGKVSLPGFFESF
jgi:hypothetical protein